MYKNSFFSYILLSIILLSSQDLFSQQTRNRIDNRGKHFFITFLHTNGDGRGDAAFNSQKFITIACEKPTKGKIIYNGTNGKVLNVVINTPNKPELFLLDTLLLRLPDPFEEPISSFSVELDFEDEVSVSGMNTMRFSSDAFLALPNEALGTEYYVLSYPSTFARDLEPVNGADFPSQFAVIATENNTSVKIDPSTEINNTSDIINVKLNKGEVYFAKAGNKFLTRKGSDVTGTKITADKPIVVYGSHQRTNIPYTESSGRDHLVEQLLPTNLWALGTIATPFNQLAKSVPDNDFMRVLACKDATTIKVDSVNFITINQGKFATIPLKKTVVISADKPVLIGQYHNSSVDDKDLKVKNDTTGDPFFSLTFAREQFDSAYSFMNYHTVEFYEHYINIAIPTERIKTLVLDGAKIGEGAFNRIGKTSYSYAQIKVTPGGHYIHASSPFSLQVYGYGGYNSYGYPAGIVLDTIFKDHIPPLINLNDTCLGAYGVGYDTAKFDFGIEEIKLMGASVNTNLFVPPFKKGDAEVPFLISLENPFKDGFAEVKVVDTAGLDNTISSRIKGFTLGFTSEPNPVKLDTLSSLSGLKFCKTITISNYGEFEQTLDTIYFGNNNSDLEVKANFPITIKPNQVFQFEVCYQHIGDTSFVANLFLGNNCIKRHFSDIPIYSGIDSLKPVLTINPDPCKSSPEIRVGEFWATNSGIAEIKILDLKNATAIIDPTNFPSKVADIIFKRTNIREDIIFNIAIKDVVGNSIQYQDTIGGFTISEFDTKLNKVGGNNFIEYGFNDVLVGLKQCDKIIFKNYGLKSLSISSIRMKDNLVFSIPPSQYPIELAPNDSIAIEFCIAPPGKGEYIDTVLIDFACGEFQEKIPMRVKSVPINGNSKDNCGNTLAISIGGYVNNDLITVPYPNPTNGSATVIFGLEEDNNITISLLDIKTNKIYSILENSYFSKGLNKLILHTEDIASGSYYILYKVGNKILKEKLIITK